MMAAITGVIHQLLNNQRKLRRMVHAIQSADRSTRQSGKVTKSRRPRKYWVNPGRTTTWWDNIRTHKTVPAEWKDNFRMSEPTFMKLCELLSPDLERKETNMRSPVDVETQVAATLYYLLDEG